MEILCYGLKSRMGAGPTDPDTDQPIPAPVIWDQANFTPGSE